MPRFAGPSFLSIIHRVVLFGTLVAACSRSTTAAAENPQPSVQFLTPQAAIDKMTVAEGFQVNAYAAEPDVVQPFAFTFDDRGRMWLAENLNYQTRGSDTFQDGPQGRILILEDTDGDGTADRRKVFIDKIFFPSGLALGFSGVWVGSPPNLLFIPDRDGDDKPDAEPEIVLDGWGRQDRHETLNSFLWGPDGWLYGCHGVFTHSEVGRPGTPKQDRVRINAGVWRFHPVSKAFEVFAWGTSNPWGLDFDQHGQMFLTACVIPHLWHIIHGGRYHRQAGRHFNPHVYDDLKTIADHRHKSAHGGARFYQADQFPEKYRQRLFMCNIHEHAVLTDITERKGSGFVGHHGGDFVLSNDPQWLGFNMELGPDGGLYVIDWHDADICGRKVVHGETGRVWRMTYGAASAPTGFNLATKSDQQLIELLSHANNWYARQARRLLHERAVAGKLAEDSHARLQQLLDTAATSALRLRALWSLHVTGGATPTLLTKLFAHEDEYLRAWSIQLLAEGQRVDDETLARWVSLAQHDPSPLVRLYLASAMQRVSPEKRWGVLSALVSRAEDKDDHNLPLMIWYAMEPAVATDTARSLTIAAQAKLPRLASFIARRIAAGATSEVRPPQRPVTIAAAKSVSPAGLTLWFKADGVVIDQRNRVSQWTDRLRNGRQAAQADAAAQPRLVTNLDGRAAVQFDGVDDYLAVDSIEDLVVTPKDSLSLAVWVRAETDRSGWQGIVTKSREAPPWYGLWIDTQRRWTFGAAGANLAKTAAQSGWRHICLVQDAGNGQRHLYVDGALVASDNALHAMAAKSARGGKGPLWIGGARSVNEFFAGALSELRFYRRALSHAEVVHLAKNPT